MSYAPNLPQAGTEIDAVQMRDQFNGLKDLIDALQSINAAQIDAVNTVPPEDPAAVSVSVTGSTLHFTFDLPQGATGAEGATGSPGSDGSNGSNGADGAQGEPGPPGEVSNADLSTAINGTSANSNAVDPLGLSVSDPPTQSEVQAVADKLDELINALRR